MWLETLGNSDPRRGNGSVRRQPRALFSVPITLRHLAIGGVRTARGVSLDISEGGIGALVEGELNVGDAVDMEFCLPSGGLSVVAILRHTSSLRSGFEFLGLNPDERLRIAALFENHPGNLSAFNAC